MNIPFQNEFVSISIKLKNNKKRIRLISCKGHWCNMDKIKMGIIVLLKTDT